jgi:hypothetical protein
MAKLTTKQRKALPKAKFAVKSMPKTGKPGFPLTDVTHDRNAISGAARSANAGNISASTKDRIQAEARAALARKGSLLDEDGKKARKK